MTPTEVESLFNANCYTSAATTLFRQTDATLCIRVLGQSANRFNVFKQYVKSSAWCIRSTVLDVCLRPQ